MPDKSPEELKEDIARLGYALGILRTMVNPIKKYQLDLLQEADEIIAEVCYGVKPNEVKSRKN